MTTQTTSGSYGQYAIRGMSATFVKDHDLIGKQDPYIVFHLGDEEVQTTVIKSAGTDAVWTEDYTIPKVAGIQEMEIKAYNKNTLLPDTFLGSARVRLDDVGIDDVKRVVLMDKKGNPAGEVVFRISATGRDTGKQTRGEGYAQQAGAGAGADYATGGRGVEGDRSAVSGVQTQGNREREVAGGRREEFTEGHREEEGVRISGQERTASERGTAATQERGLSERDTVCNHETVKTTEDRPVVKERKEYIMEHRPVEKEYVVETKFKGERELGTKMEHLGTEENIVEAAKAQSPCETAPKIVVGERGGNVQGRGGNVQGRAQQYDTERRI